MTAPYLRPLMVEQIAQHTAASERVVQMRLIDLAHQPQVFG